MKAPDLTDLIGAVYDAASGGLGWTDLGDQICRLMSAQRVYLGVGQSDGTLPNLLRVPDQLDTAYSEYYHKLDPFRIRAKMAARENPTALEARLGSDIVPRAELLRSEYYAGYGKRRGTRHIIGGQLDTRGQLLIGISRDSIGAAFSEHELGSVQALLPHLRRGLQLRDALAAKTPPASAGLAAIEALPFCVILVDGSMRVALVNAAGDRLTSDRRSGLRIVRSGPPTTSGRGVLTASHAGDASGLRMLVAATAMSGPGGALRLRSPDSPDAKATLVAVLVSPVPARMVTADPSNAPEGLAHGLALVIARDLARPSTPSPKVLGSLFSLSPGEAAVATAMLGGTTAEDVAMARRVSLDTVRSQIQTVLRKTEAANLRDFERMAATLALMHPAASDRG